MPSAPNPSASRRLYLEQVAALAGLEGDQRDRFFQEQAAVPAQAPAPEQLARCYSLRGRWIIPVLMAAGQFFFVYFNILIITSLLGLHLPFNRAYMAVPFAALFTLIQALTGPRIEVLRDGLQIHSGFRRKTLVPYHSITKVQPGKPSIGARAIAIKYDNDHWASISRRMTNFYWAIAALQENTEPGTITPSAQSRFTRFQARPAGMKLSTRILLTVVVFLGALLLLLDCGYAWNNDGVPYSLGIGIILATLISAGLMQSAAEHIRRAFSALTASFGIWIFFTLISHTLATADIRNLLIPAGLLVLIALTLIWWRIRSILLPTLLFFGCMALAIGAMRLLPPPVHAPVEALGTANFIHPSLFRFPSHSSRSTPTALLLGLRPTTEKKSTSGYYAAILSPTGTREITLGDGSWAIVGADGPQRVLLLQEKPVNDGSKSLFHSYFVLQENGTLTADITTSNTFFGAAAALLQDSVISPTHRYLVTAASKSGNLVILDRTTSSSREFPQIKAPGAMRWQNDHVLRLRRFKPLENPPPSDPQITFFDLDVATGETTQTGQLALAHDSTPAGHFR